LRSFSRKALVVVIGLSIIVAIILLKLPYDVDKDGASVVARPSEARTDAEPAQTVGEASPSGTAKMPSDQSSPRKANEVPAIHAMPTSKTVLLAPEVAAPASPAASARRKLQKVPQRRHEGRDFRYDWNSREDASNARGRLYAPDARYVRPWAW
jgi:hypothetical protein